MNDNHFKYGESQSSAQPVEGGESMQGWTSFILNMKPSCFSDQGDGGRTGQMPLRTLKNHNLEKALGPKPLCTFPPVISSNWPIQRKLIYACHQGILD